MTHETNNPKERIEHLIELTSNLADLFDKENSLLVAHRISEFSSLHTEKAKLTNAYASAIRDIANNRNLLEGAGSTLMNALHAITTRFNNLAAHQRTLLEGSHRAGASIVQAIKDEVKENCDNSTPHYNQLGAKGHGTAPIVVSMNERA